MKKNSSLDKLSLAAGLHVKERKYWLNKLAGELVKCHFPYDFRNKQEKNFSTIYPLKNVSFQFPGPLYDKVIKLSGNTDVKLHMILVSGLFMLLHKYTQDSDIIIGSPILKQENESEFINTVLLFRNETTAQMSFKELLLDVRKTIIEAAENQNYPLEVLLEEINMPFKDNEGFPLFDTVLLLENLHDKKYLQGINYNMLLSFSRTDEGIEGLIEYNSLLYRDVAVEQIAAHYLYILDQALTNIDLPLYGIELLSEQEKQQLLCDFNNTDTGYPQDKLLHHLFEEQVARTPGNIALVGESLELNVFRPMAYREFNTRADLLAKTLQQKGVGPDTVVGLLIEPSIEMMIGIMGILKSGGAYLPIDPTFPQERIDYILKDSSAKILLTADEIASLSMECVTNSHRSANIDHHANQLAYLIYTSGTTGKSKGVMLEHRNVVAYVHAFLEHFHIDSTDTVIQLASYCFDVFVEEVFPVLSKGGKIVIPGRSDIVEINRLLQLMTTYRVTIIDCTPLLLNEFNKINTGTGCAALASVHTFISGGDVLKPAYVEYLLKNGSVYNTYGPTESTVCATYYNYTGAAGDLTSIPIGKPISNYKIHILDEHRKHVPIGVAGELYISGPGVARGYLNRPELTAEKFIDFHHSKFYRTGDLARWLYDGPPAGGASGGVIEYLGRIDFQVKIRGFRIELEEIEAHLAKYESIEKAVVIDLQEEKENGEKYLCAYIVSKETLDFSLLRNYLAQSLPEYMIPAFFVPLEQIPLTPNGKVNRKALPAPTVTAGETYIAPGNKIEEKLAEIWAEILNLKKEAIGVNHSFFELGGHSLKATVLAARIHKELDIKLPVLEIFRNQTIRQLSGYISRVKPTEKFAAIEPSEKKEYYLLSSVQRRLYFIFQLEKNSTNYNMPDIIPMKGKVDIERIEEVFDRLIRRHESFRTSFHLIDQEPVQRVHDEVEFKIARLGDWGQDAGERIDQIFQEFIKPFDLSCAPLLRVGLVKKSSGNPILLVDIHHIIMDAVSMEVLKEEFSILYAGKRESLPMLHLQYKDYSEWQQRERVKGALKNQEKFWLENLAGELPVLRLPLDFSRPLVQSFEGNTVDFQLGEKEVQQLKELASATGSTLYILLLSIFNLLLFKLSDQEDIIVGTVMAARRHSDLEKVIGMFVNTLAVRNFPWAEKTFWEFLTEVRQSILALYENQDYPFEDIVEKIDVIRDTGRNPIFDVLFTMQNPIQPDNLTEYASFGYESKIAKFDITLGAVETDENLAFSLNYCTLLFKQETIDRFIIYFMNIVSSILLNPYQEISNVDMLTKKEKQQLLIEFNDNAKASSIDSTICELFEMQVKKSPDHIALIGKNICGSPVMTYRELNERANHLAGKLQEKGIYADAAGTANSIAAIVVERSFETIIGIWGILKVGGAYLPIDPLYPKERIEYMLADSGVQILVGNRHVDSMKLNCQLPIVNGELMNESAAILQHSAPIVPPIIHPSRHLIYIIYTSGTIGKPKGAAVYHAGFLNLMHWFITEFGLNAKDRNLLLTSLSFDLTQKNIFAPLVTGGALILPPQDYFDHYGILQCIEEKQLTWFNCTPGMLTKLIEYCSDEDLKKLVSLRYVFLGGEPIIMKVLRKWTTSSYFRAVIVNTYGPTECADISSYYAIENPWKFNEQNVPIGKPIYNVNLYILNRCFQLLPVHVPGNIFVSGRGVGAGYLNRLELTHEKFMNEKLLNQKLSIIINSSSCKLYNTGDFARWLANGNIEFLGRIDQQVKIRGFRIELEEIEVQLLKNNSLKEAIVLDKIGEDGEKYLCAYIVMAKGFQLDSTALKQYLAGRLPDYMIPAYFVPVERIPVTAHGKVDRRALPEPLILLEKDYEAPKSELEDKIVDIWSEVLGIEKSKISVNANFFDIGGHSLKLMIMIAKIHRMLNLKLELMQVYKAPTIRNIALLIGAIQWVNGPDLGNNIDEDQENTQIIL